MHGEKTNNPAALSRNNVLATNFVIDNLCSQELCKGLIYFSSIAVFFGIQDEVITEESEKKPDNFYGFSKLICENLIQTKLKDKTTVIIRPTNIIAPNTSTTRRTDSSLDTHWRDLRSLGVELGNET